MKAFWRSFVGGVGVCFEPSRISLAVRRGQCVAAAVESPCGAGEYRNALASLVAQERVEGARCATSLPVASCLVQWVSLNDARLRDLHAAVAYPAFWQTHLGVDPGTHSVWWRFIRGGGNKTAALIAAAPREDVDFYTGIIRGAGLAVGAVGVSCFDYFDDVFATDTSRVTLVLDCDDACVVAVGAFGVRAHAVAFDQRSVAALTRGDTQARAEVIDSLAACVRRCVADERATTRLRADVRVVAAHGGDWLESLQACLSGFGFEWHDGWSLAGMDAPDDGSWRLPRAAMRLRRMRRGAITDKHHRAARNVAVDFAARNDGRQRLMFAVAAVVCLSAMVSVYVHGTLLVERRHLQPDAQRYLQLEGLQARNHAEVKELRESLSHRVSFYSGIQRVSFERKLMPHLFSLIEYAAFEGVWLNTIHFKQPDFLRITGRSLDDEKIARFIERLRAADEIVEVFLKSAASANDNSSTSEQQLKDFVISCHLKNPSGVGWTSLQ